MTIKEFAMITEIQDNKLEVNKESFNIREKINEIISLNEFICK